MEAKSTTARFMAAVGAVAMVGGMGGWILVGSVGPAFASGTSNTVDGCYSTWGSTGTNAHCFKVTKTLNYRNHAACEAQPDKTSSWTEIVKGSTVPNFGQINCTFTVTSSSIQTEAA
jgi:hypothetical protein